MAFFFYSKLIDWQCQYCASNGSLAADDGQAVMTG